MGFLENMQGVARRASDALNAFAQFNQTTSQQAVAPAPPSSNITPPAPGFGYNMLTPRNMTGAQDMARLYDALFGKIATRLGPSNPRYSTFSGELTPENISGAVQQADLGLPFTLCDMYRRAIEQDAHLAGITAQRFARIVANEDRVEAPKSMARDPLAVSIANWNRAIKEQVSDLDQARFALLWADGQGYSAAEIIWGWRRVVWFTHEGKRVVGQYLIPVKLEIIEGRSFQFDRENGEPLLWLCNDLIRFPQAKIVFHRSYGLTCLTERRGFMRSCLWLHAIKQWGIRDMAEYLHIYGIPQMIAEYDPAKYKYDEARHITNTVQEVLGQGGIPTVGMGQMSLRNDTPLPNGALVHRDAVIFLNQQMTEVVTLGPLTMESSGGSYGLGDVHAEGAFAGQVLSGQNLCATLRRDVWTPAIEMNVFRLATQLSAHIPGGADPQDILSMIPSYTCQIERVSDPEKRQKILSKAMEDGYPVSREQYAGDLQLDAAKDEEDQLKGKAVAVPSSGAVVSAVEASDGVVAPNPNAPSGGAAPESADASGSEKAAHPTALDLTSTAQGAVITVNEARASMKLGPWPGEDGDLSVAEFMAKHSTVISDAASAEQGDEPQESK